MTHPRKTQPFKTPARDRDVLILQPGEGRRYELGRLTAIFKADEAETESRYSISEWWMEPGFPGVGAHNHPDNDEIFVGLEGKPSLLIGADWIPLDPGAFIRIPAGVTHDFRNQTEARCGMLSLYVPGGFERDMPKIGDWFARNPA
jgi:mannose-6-phosphate isomerase-like protein (cupin superfamily)